MKIFSCYGRIYIKKVIDRWANKLKFILLALASARRLCQILNYPEKLKSTRNKVLKILWKGYKPNANARGLPAGVRRLLLSSSLGFCASVAEWSGYWWQCNKAILRLFITESGLNKDFGRWRVGVDGILLIWWYAGSGSGIKNTPVPVVFVNQLSPSEEFGSVGLDYENAAYQTTKIMIERGNKDIMFISTEHKYTVNDMKEKGYRRAMEEANLPVNIIYTSGDLNINEKDFQEALSKGAPEVALAVRDSIAISFMNVAQKMGYKPS